MHIILTVIFTLYHHNKSSTSSYFSFSCFIFLTPECVQTVMFFPWAPVSHRHDTAHMSVLVGQHLVCVCREISSILVLQVFSASAIYWQMLLAPLTVLTLMYPFFLMLLLSVKSFVTLKSWYIICFNLTHFM